MFENNINRKVIAVDLDNTLTMGEPAWEVEPTPHKEHIEIVRQLYFKGNIIIIHSARLWENANMTVAWLIKNHVPFHGIMLGKMGADVYCDDKNCGFEELKELYNKPNIINHSLTCYGCGGSGLNDKSIDGICTICYGKGRLYV